MLVKQQIHEKAARMIELRRLGWSYRMIGKELNCTGSAVCQMIARATKWKGYIGEIDDSYRIWIENEAARTKTDAATVAKALLIDAIEDARDARR